MRYRLNALNLLILLVLAGACTSGSYQNTVNGGLAGGALGAGSGAIVGGSSGKTGHGAAIGAGLGTASGVLAGSALDRQADRNRQLEAHIAVNEQQIEENRLLIEQLKAKGADVRGTERGVVINLPDILFEFDRASLTPAAQRTISEVSSVLGGVDGRKISVEGHTDSIGTVLYNKQLSQKRAFEVANDLRKKGLGTKKISSRGLGEGYPVATNNSEIGRSRNRRVEIIIENR